MRMWRPEGRKAFDRELSELNRGMKEKKMNESSPKNRYIHIHPIWYTFIKYCESVKFGEIESLKIQDGLPMVAEGIKKKILFAKNEIPRH
jgi:hypothetical protein